MTAGEKVATLVEHLSARIIRNVCELPDYTSPDDQPDLITCTVDELDACVMRAIESSDFNALLTQRDALEAREKVLRKELLNAANSLAYASNMVDSDKLSNKLSDACRAAREAALLSPGEPQS